MLFLLLSFVFTRRKSRNHRHFDFLDTRESIEKAKYHIRRAVTRRIRDALRERQMTARIQEVLSKLGFTDTDRFTDFLDQMQLAEQYQPLLYNGKRKKDSTNSIGGAYLPIVVADSQTGKKMWEFSDSQKQQVISNPVFGFAAYPLFPDGDVDYN